MDFSKADRTHNLSGYFGEQSLIGMFETSDFECIARVFRFLGAIVDVFCRNENKALVTKVNYCMQTLILARREN